MDLLKVRTAFSATTAYNILTTVLIMVHITSMTKIIPKVHVRLHFKRNRVIMKWENFIYKLATMFASHPYRCGVVTTATIAGALAIDHKD